MVLGADTGLQRADAVPDLAAAAAGELRHLLAGGRAVPVKEWWSVEARDGVLMLTAGCAIERLPLPATRDEITAAVQRLGQRARKERCG